MGATIKSILCAGLGSGDEVRLLDYLFERQGYNPLVRPVANLSDTVPSTRPTQCRESVANLSDTVRVNSSDTVPRPVANLSDTVRVNSSDTVPLVGRQPDRHCAGPTRHGFDSAHRRGQCESV